MRKLLFVLSACGVLAAGTVAYVLGITRPPQPPVFSPAPNPYASGIYTNGIVESDQPSGENVNVYPEVPGTVAQIMVSEGQAVRRGMPLLALDDSIQRATVEQLQLQTAAASAALAELRAQPRPETLAITAAQVAAAKATLKTAQDELDKQRGAYELDVRAVSKDALDGAANAVAVAGANLEVAQRQHELTRAGAWSYDVANQEKQVEALRKSTAAATALLGKYTLRAPRDGVVLSINPAVGSFVSAQGAYESYSGGMTPVMVVGSPAATFNVRCFVDEILLPRLPPPSRMKATMFIRGSQVKVPLSFVRVQPLVSPKIELADQRTERVDVRVLPVIFKIEKPANLTLYQGLLVDVYIGE